MGDAISSAVGGLLAIIFIALNVAVFAPVTREHCLDLGASQTAGAVRIDSKWTFVAWPPPPVSWLDPGGRCVRNSVLRQGLDLVGVWKLPTPLDQVRDHVQEQLGN